MKTLILVGDFHEVRELVLRTGNEIKGIVGFKSKEFKKELETHWESDDEFVLECAHENIFITPDLPHKRKMLFKKYTDAGANVVSLVCPSAIISKSATIGEFHCIQSLVNISSNSTLGVGVKVNVGANIMHDCHIDNFVTVAPNAVLLGNVTVGEESYIGANATVLPGIRIGEGAVVGAGSVVTKDVSDRKIVYGNPAK